MDKQLENAIHKMLYNMHNNKLNTARQDVEAILAIKIQQIIADCKDKPLNLNK